MPFVNPEADQGSRKPEHWRYGFWAALLTGLAWAACFRFPDVWLATGIGEADRPFFDLTCLLAALDGARAGLNPILHNDLDPYYRHFFYSEWWLELRHLGLGRGDLLWLGTALLLSVLVTAVVMVRPENWKDVGRLVLLLVSPALLMAVNRANNDLQIFVVIGAGLLCFRSDRWPQRALGIVFLSSAALLKYYPLVTLIVLLDLRTRREWLAGLGLYLLVLVLGWPAAAEPFKAASQYAPQPDWLFAFGAPVLLRNFGLNFAAGWVVPAVLMMTIVAWSSRAAILAPSTPTSDGDRTRELEFICGAALIVGLFFLGATYVYKLVFAAWLLPYLYVERPNPGQRLWVMITRRLLFGVVWLEGAMAVAINVFLVHRSDAFNLALLKGVLLVSQLLTWALIACLFRAVLIYTARRGREILGFGPMAITS